MIVAIDFDETITTNPPLWLSIMNIMRNAGWDVIVVTYRKPDADPHELFFLQQQGFRIYFTGQVGKRKWLWERQRISPDIWIDDSPESILLDYDTTKWKFDLSSIVVDRFATSW